MDEQADPPQDEDSLEELRRIRSERDWLVHRLASTHVVGIGDRRFTGKSSDALVEAAFGGPLPPIDRYPKHPADLCACERTYLTAPRHLRASMKPLLLRYRAWFDKHYGYRGVSSEQCQAYARGTLPVAPWLYRQDR
ncbi:MAG: hypothetical protein KC549_02715 [Myxococcales bacterium]|nr:hypothetical protein [Myxococcales bacterium]MCB9548909.1 hypothetical protein [Myxococcales bacterium]